MLQQGTHKQTATANCNVLPEWPCTPCTALSGSWPCAVVTGGNTGRSQRVWQVGCNALAACMAQPHDSKSTQFSPADDDFAVTTRSKLLSIHCLHVHDPAPSLSACCRAHTTSATSPTFGFDADVMMPLICSSWLTRLLLRSRMLAGPKGWLLYSRTCR